ncbi:hypothetical protein ACLF6K_32780 [Streptomyces xanthophaeus]|uniref:hypothetical protein n=1 Tax=Streptomyces xanthophaeus TaxID=67385 RepID=UPI00398FEBB6
MSNEIGGNRPQYRAEDAALAHAGTAQSLPGPGEPRAMEESDRKSKKAARRPTDKQLDAREKKLTSGRRKAMGPTPDNVPETVPDEPSPRPPR